MDDEKLTQIFNYLKIGKSSVFATPYFIIPMIIALPNYLAACFTSTLEVRVLAVVTAVIFTLVGLGMSLANETDKKKARKKYAQLIDKYGIDTVYDDFYSGDIFLNDKLCIGKKFIFAYRRIFELDNTFGFELRKVTLNFIPVSYMLGLRYLENGKNDTAVVGMLDYFRHGAQIAEISGNYMDKKGDWINI